ncbi:hypothetical protein PCASD_13147 [Puccinia coronata f. sp. avenae]|uniref:Uncharacterized protein n=1 Tax=Puccinia coronata f. sp. avenae TaxID=200324 RepID=A0A2N5U676_9BASI|nr:hypothetical protein PCASD_24824 [Puccinia coronata f. sp. avenae]PLW33168.1 hypothetical protein PCASD_13147 [Puccinia coronata f. sp. avenae]
MSKFVFLVGLLIPFPIPCHAPSKDSIDLELRLSSSSVNRDSSLNEYNNIRETSSRVPLASVPDFVISTPLRYVASQAVTDPPSTGTHMSTPALMNDNIASTMFRSSIEVPKYQETRGVI